MTVDIPNFKITFENSENKHVVYAIGFNDAKWIAELMHFDSRNFPSMYNLSPNNTAVIVFGLSNNGTYCNKVYEVRN